MEGKVRHFFRSFRKGGDFVERDFHVGDAI